MTGASIYMDIIGSLNIENCTFDVIIIMIIYLIIIFFKGNSMDTSSEEERVGGSCINSQGDSNSYLLKSLLIIKQFFIGFI